MRFSTELKIMKKKMENNAARLKKFRTQNVCYIPTPLQGYFTSLVSLQEKNNTA